MRIVLIVAYHVQLSKVDFYAFEIYNLHQVQLWEVKVGVNAGIKPEEI
jgi:hypothetical protein